MFGFGKHAHARKLLKELRKPAPDLERLKELREPAPDLECLAELRDIMNSQLSMLPSGLLFDAEKHA